MDYKDKRLIGSDVYFSGKGFVSDIVKVGGLFDEKRGIFKLSKYSHVAPIVWLEDRGELGLLEALMPKVKITVLSEVIKERQNENPVLCILNDNYTNLYLSNPDKYNDFIMEHNNQKYNLVMAGLAGLDVIPDDWNWFLGIREFVYKWSKVQHCSYVTALSKTLFNIIDSKKYICEEMSPDDCFYMNGYNGHSIYKEVVKLKVE